MQLKIRHLPITTGGIRVAVLNKKDAITAHLREGDRINIKRMGDQKAQTVIAVIDITNDDNLVPPGYIGMFHELIKQETYRNGQRVDITYSQKPDSIYYIKKKLAGATLNDHEIETIIDDISHNRLTDIELTYFVAAGYMREFNDQEIVSMINTIIKQGDTLDFRTPTQHIVMDKHCIGGVAANRTTCVVVPIIAASGLPIPKSSSRSITSPAGTADTMEVLCNVSLTIDDIKKIVRKTNGCFVWGGSLNLAPADDKIIKVEHPLSLDPVGQLLVSILAKKKSVGATHALIDIPFGDGSKISNKSRAVLLKNKFETIGKRIGMHIKVVITDGTQPIGNGIGPALEARDILWTLQNDPRASHQLRQKAIQLAGIMLEMGKKAKKGKGELLAQELLDSGKAYNKFIEIIKAQGAKNVDANKISVGKYTKDVYATTQSTITHIDNTHISTVAKLAGAPKDKEAGVYLYHHVGDYVQEDDKLYTIYSASQEKLQQALHYASKHNAITLKTITQTTTKRRKKAK